MQFLEPGVSERIEFILKGIAIEAVIILGLACALLMAMEIWDRFFAEPDSLQTNENKPS
jgi:hypothetical protein